MTELTLNLFRSGEDVKQRGEISLSINIIIKYLVLNEVKKRVQNVVRFIYVKRVRMNNSNKTKGK